MIWCEKDCHEQMMWCGRKKRLFKAEFVAMMQKRKEGKTGGAKDLSGGDFKIVLAAMTSDKDFRILQDQFMSVK